MTADPNNWPDPARPGVPENPEQSGRRWLQPMKPWRAPYPVFWVAGRGWAWNGVPHWPTQDTVSRYRYLGPCLSPEEVAARETAAFNAGAEAMREAAAQEAQSRESEGGEYGMAARHIATAIRALPIPARKGMP